MDIATGADILSIPRLERILKDEDKAFLDYIYSAAEQEAALQRPIPMLYYATRFAGKEAVVKALSRCDAEFRFHEIEILSDRNDAPFVRLSGGTGEAAAKHSLLDISISLSSDTDYAIAFVAAIYGEKT